MALYISIRTNAINRLWPLHKLFARCHLKFLFLFCLSCDWCHAMLCRCYVHRCVKWCNFTYRCPCTTHTMSINRQQFNACKAIKRFSENSHDFVDCIIVAMSTVSCQNRCIRKHIVSVLTSSTLNNLFEVENILLSLISLVYFVKSIFSTFSELNSSISLLIYFKFKTIRISYQDTPPWSLQKVHLHPHRF